MPVEYIKILSGGAADSITAYNKGLELDDYAYYDPQKDSIIYRFLTDYDKKKYTTIVGAIHDDNYIDTLNDLILTLKKYPLPITFDTAFNGDSYDGPELYVEFKDNSGLHYYEIIEQHNDTVNSFFKFFFRLRSLPWNRHVVDNKMVNADQEAVSALKHLGLYEKRVTPYIPLHCEDGIDKTQLVGSWRTVSDRHANPNTFNKLILKKNGDCYYDATVDNKPEKHYQGSYTVTTKADNLRIIIGHIAHRYAIRKLSASCLEILQEGTGDVILYNRL